MDNASHFKNTYVLDFLEGVGARVIFSIPYKPENKWCGREGSAERKIYIRANSQKLWNTPEELKKMNEYLSLPKLI